MPLFSVIVPVYNVEPYIRQCLDSILAQTCRDFELILVNDGSTDRCGAICDEYAARDPRIQVIHKANGGLVSARQAGVQEARGAYCVAIDSDDWVADTYLQSFEAVIAAHAPDMVCSGLRLTDGDRVQEMLPPVAAGLYDRAGMEKSIFPRLIQSPAAQSFEPNICSKAIRTELYRPCQLAVNPQIKNGEDSSCTIPCFFRAQTVFIMRECGYFYRYNRASMTKGLKPMPWSQQAVLSAHLRANVDPAQFDFEDQLNRRVCHGMFNICMSQFFGAGSYAEIRRAIKAHLRESACREAVKKARFSSASARLMHFALKHELVFLMYLYARRKKKV